MDLYQQMIHKSRYARWDNDKKRRETWEETVNRYIYFFLLRGQINVEEAEYLTEMIVSMQVMPSMRALMTAGDALDRDNVAGFNCSYLAIDHPRCFDELMYVLMCGTGVGFSVERADIAKLPEVAEELHETDTVIVVSDSKIGWASAFRELVSLLYSGKIPKYDVSKVRPAGAKLKTFGGRASGPAPLVKLFDFTIELFKKAKGRKLTSLECHDLCCKIAEIVVVGGVRRSALISLSNLSDDRMRKAKQGQWWIDNGQRALANNSVAYTEKPDFDSFLSEMKSLYDSKCGERGVFSRVAAKAVAARNGRRDIDHNFGTNPCSEIILRSNQFCNLTEVIVRPEDTAETLADKVRAATILGTLQSSLTDFRYLRPIWKRNTEEECLLGVSMTGICDNTHFSTPSQELKDNLLFLKQHAVDVNKEWAERLGINQSTAITCVKPSGTVSQLVNSSSGIHPRFSDYYIRTVRMDVKDPLASLMKDSGFIWEEAIGNPSTLVFSFPQRAPEGSVKVAQVTANQQLELWELYQDYWCEHKPSVTVYYSDDEFFDICSWMWKKFDKVSGVSFLPRSDHVYQQAPYQEVDEETYKLCRADQPVGFSWDNLEHYEKDDTTTASQELACVGNSCEIP